MKKPGILCLLFIACIFLGGLIGFFIGRNYSNAAVQISKNTVTVPPTIGTSPQDQTDSPASIPTQSDPTASQPLPSQGTSQLINVNTATLEQLQELPGIGPVLAQSIIDFRTENGPFRSLEELMLVSGIGPARLEKLQKYATVGG